MTERGDRPVSGSGSTADLPGGRAGQALAGALGGRDEQLDTLLGELVRRRAELEQLDDSDPVVVEQLASVHHQLGAVYVRRQGDDPADDFERAVDHFRTSLGLRDERRDRSWVRTASALGSALRHRVHGDREVNIEEGIAMMRQALAEATRLGLADEAASVQSSLGLALTFRIAGDLRRNLAEAIDRFRSAQEVFRPEVNPLRWAIIETNLATALLRVPGDVGRGTDRDALEAAATAAAGALERFDLDEVPAHRRRAANTLGSALAQLDDWPAAAEAYLIAAEAAESMARAAGDPRKELADASSAHRSAAHALARAGRPLAAASVIEQNRARLTSDRPIVANPPNAFLDGEPLGAAELRASVGAAGTVLYLLPTDDGSVGIVLRLDDARDVITAETVVADQLRSADVRRLIASPVLGHGRGGHTRGRLAQHQAPVDPFAAAPEEVLDELAERLAPITAAVAGDARIVIVACGSLGIVPVQAIWLAGPTEATASRELVHAPSAAMHAMAARSRGPTTSRLVAVGVNEFAGRLPGLVAAEQEARWIAALPFDDVELLVGPDATAERVLVEASTATHLHLATHGTFGNTGHPGAAGLYCAEGTFLSFAQLLATDLTSLELVTSSACWSGLHDVLYLPDEVDGFSTALLRHGARAVVAPSWRVDDVDAACLMVTLYERHRLDGLPVAAATAAAQSWLRDLTPAERVAFIHERALLAPTAGATTAASRGPTASTTASTWAAFRHVGA